MCSSDLAIPITIGTSDRERVLSLLSPSPIETDELIRESGLTAGHIAMVLLEFELAGKVIRHSGGRVSRIS